MSDKPTYSIVRWDDSFENHESRKIRRLGWVPIPNRHDGKGFKRVSRDPLAVEVFCAWNLIVEVASRMPERGILADDDGPLDAQDLADKTNYPASIFESAFVVLTRPEIGWLASTGEHPVMPGRDGVTTGDAGTEGKGTERKGKGWNGSVEPIPPFTGEAFLKALTNFEKHYLQSKRKKWTPVSRERNYAHFLIWGEKRSTDALEFSARMGYTGVFEDAKRVLPTPQQPIFDVGPKGDPNCLRCNGTQTEVVPGKGARFCDCKPLTEDDE